MSGAPGEGAYPFDLSNTEPIDCSIVAEPWYRYELEDGTLLKLKVVVIDIFRSTRTTP